MKTKQSYYSSERAGFIRDEGYGLVHICYGPGIGKTTRSIGLAVRAAGAGLQVSYVQFMKSGNSSEVNSFKLLPNINYKCPGKHPFILSKGPRPIHYEHAETALWFAKRAVRDRVNLLVCDEILTALLFEVLLKDQLLELMDMARGKVELLMTGVDAPADIMVAADYATKFVQEKHPYYKGHIARKGIEY